MFKAGPSINGAPANGIVNDTLPLLSACPIGVDDKMKVIVGLARLIVERIADDSAVAALRDHAKTVVARPGKWRAAVAENHVFSTV